MIGDGTDLYAMPATNLQITQKSQDSDQVERIVKCKQSISSPQSLSGEPSAPGSCEPTVGGDMSVNATTMLVVGCLEGAVMLHPS